MLILGSSLVLGAQVEKRGEARGYSRGGPRKQRKCAIRLASAVWGVRHRRLISDDPTTKTHAHAHRYTRAARTKWREKDTSSATARHNRDRASDGGLVASSHSSGEAVDLVGQLLDAICAVRECASVAASAEDARTARGGSRGHGEAAYP